jgi:hypothetical protein
VAVIVAAIVRREGLLARIFPSGCRLVAIAPIGYDSGFETEGQLHYLVMEFAQARPVPDTDEGGRQARELRVQALFRGHIERAGGLVEDREAGTVEQEPREG